MPSDYSTLHFRTVKSMEKGKRGRQEGREERRVAAVTALTCNTTYIRATECKLCPVITH